MRTKRSPTGFRVQVFTARAAHDAGRHWLRLAKRGALPVYDGFAANRMMELMMRRQAWMMPGLKVLHSQTGKVIGVIIDEVS